MPATSKGLRSELELHMTRERLPEIHSVPLRGRVSTRSTPLLDVEMYRPGPVLAFIVLLLPVLVALSGAAVYGRLDGAVPTWLPFTLLLWAPCLPALWFTMQSVRVSSGGVGAGRPWQQWEEVAWEDIERIEARGPFLRIVTSQGHTVTFAPMLLRDGGRLRRQLLLRLPAHVVVGRLASEAQRFVALEIRSTAEGGYSGVLITRARLRWRLAFLFLAVGIVACVAWVIGTQTLASAQVIASVAAFIVVILLLTLAWSSQVVHIDGSGISLVSPILRRRRSLAWKDMDLIEHSPRQTVVRVRGKDRRLVCAGPGLLSPAQATLMRGMLHEYCDQHGVPILRRVWVF